MKYYEKQTSDPALTILWNQGQFRLYALLIQIRDLYASEDCKISKNLLLQMFPDDEANINELKTRKFIEFTHSRGSDRNLKVPHILTHFKVVFQKKKLFSQRFQTVPDSSHATTTKSSQTKHNTIEYNKTRDVTKDVGALDCKHIVFSWQECRSWALENFSVSDSKIDDFLTHLRITFNAYENKSWIMANGERAKSPKALITSIMKKKYQLVKQKL